MQTTVIALLALVAVAAAQPQYAYRFQTPHGATHADEGRLVPGPEGYVLVRSGSHSYTAPEGKIITLRYTADENGYHPVGDHLPVSVPLPAGF